MFWPPHGGKLETRKGAVNFLNLRPAPNAVQRWGCGLRKIRSLPVIWTVWTVLKTAPMLTRLTGIRARQPSSFPQISIPGQPAARHRELEWIQGRAAAAWSGGWDRRF